LCRIFLVKVIVTQQVKKLPTFMKPKGSLLCSQEPANEPNPYWAKWTKFIPWYHYFRIHFNIILTPKPGFPKFSLPLRFSGQNFICIFDFPHGCYVPHPLHLPWYNHLNSMHWRVYTMKNLIMQFSPLSCYFLTSKYSLQHCILKHP